MINRRRHSHYEIGIAGWRLGWGFRSLTRRRQCGRPAAASDFLHDVSCSWGAESPASVARRTRRWLAAATELRQSVLSASGAVRWKKII